jgi:hypothetical protein
VKITKLPSYQVTKFKNNSMKCWNSGSYSSWATLVQIHYSKVKKNMILPKLIPILRILQIRHWDWWATVLRFPLRCRCEADPCRSAGTNKHRRKRVLRLRSETDWEAIVPLLRCRWEVTTYRARTLPMVSGMVSSIHRSSSHERGIRLPKRGNSGHVIWNIIKKF